MPEREVTLRKVSVATGRTVGSADKAFDDTLPETPDPKAIDGVLGSDIMTRCEAVVIDLRRLFVRTE